MFETVVIVWVLVLILVVVTLFAGVKTVPQGQVWTVERFGAYTRMLQPGSISCCPMSTGRPQAERAGAGGRDPGAERHHPRQCHRAVDGIIYYRVMEPEKAAYQVTNLTLALTTLAMTNIRAVIGEMELDATLSSRERINTALLIILDGATEPWGVKVSRVEIRKIEPPENLIRAMNLQMTAERERRAVVARAEGEREAAILRAEGEKQALILPPRAASRRPLRDAEARVALAGAEAEATQMVSEAATQLRPGRAALLHRRPLCAGVPGAGIGAEHAAGGGADGVLGARRRHRAGDAVVPRRRRRRSDRQRRLPTAPPPPPPVVPPPMPPVAPAGARHGEPARRDERLDHLGGRRSGAADARDPRARRLHDVARPRGLRHRAGRAGERHRLRAAGGDVRRAGGDLAGGRPALSPSPPARLNTQQAGLAGRSATALTFQGREGRVRVGDSDWAARVPPDVRGTRVRLAAARGGRRWHRADRPPGGMNRWPMP